MTYINPFSQLLRSWRTRAELTQLQLAESAKTTPRYVSFLETGKSRPGQQMVKRLGQALELNEIELDKLLDAAGFPQVASKKRPSSVANLEDLQFKESVIRILDKHSPFPGFASDTLSRILLANEPFHRHFPGMTNKTAEQSTDDFFGPGFARNNIENWAELAWHFIDRRHMDAAKSGDRRVKALADRASNHMNGIPRPTSAANNTPMAYYPVFLIGGVRLPMFATAMRYENINNPIASDVRLTLFHPLNADVARFFYDSESRSKALRFA